jgi:predicted permease
MVYVDALARVVPVLLLFVLGALLRRRSVIRTDTVDDLRSIVLKLALPSALFLTFLRVSLEPRYLWIVVSVFGACVILFGAGRWIGRVIGVTSPLLPALLTGFEAGMLGYAIFGATFGSAELYRFAIVDIGQVAFVFFVLATVLQRGSTGEMPSLRSTGLSFVRTPVILGIAGGILGSIVGLGSFLDGSPMGKAALETLSLVASLTTPLIAIVIGYGTRLSLGSLGRPIRTVAVRLAIWVVLAIVFDVVVVDGLLHLDRLQQAAVMTMAVLPPPFVIPLFVGPDSRWAYAREEAINTLSLATVVTLVAFSLVAVAFA